MCVGGVDLGGQTPANVWTWVFNLLGMLSSGQAKGTAGTSQAAQGEKTNKETIPKDAPWGSSIQRSLGTQPGVHGPHFYGHRVS